jgi:hypothetical protein
VTIQPMPTMYSGIKFRSRLEARWAYFFDQLRIRWEYEPEAYEYSPYGGKVWRYLPDFYLPDHGYWCEVKGDVDAVDGDYLHMLGHVGHFLPGVHNSSGTCGVALLGAIPDVRHASIEIPAFTVVSHYKGCETSWASFEYSRSGGQVIVRCEHRFTFENPVGPSSASNFDEWELAEVNPRLLWRNGWIKPALDRSGTVRAYEAARAHRWYK